MKPLLDYKLFIEVMQAPSRLLELNPADLDDVLRYARRASLLGSLVARVSESLEVPENLRDRFEGAQIYAAEHARRLHWELDQLAPVVTQLDCPVVVLKGGAYLAMDLLSSRGRLVSDLDLLVAEGDLHSVEQAMLDNGYRTQKQDDYDQHYYRDWMHELPPMAHVARGTTVDLHHNIAPPVSRLKIDASLLLERAVPLVDGLPYMRLSDEDMVLHLCVHMFHDGELDNSLRELFDLDAMLRRFAQDEGFWLRLVQRAQQLALVRPLYFALHFSQKILHTPVAKEVNRFLEIAAPIQPWRWLIERVMQLTLLPAGGERPTVGRTLALQVMFLRAHWLRMPTGMLIKHLWTQLWRRGGLKTAEQAALQQRDDAGA